ncbi:MAG TPA: SDR family oxidoreductase [Bdellovibrionota bacterium]|nr:SDR family oxidoreductase [Bdellovibrionota bacterium]
MNLKKQVALITGGARRVGREIALALAERGCHVAISYRTSNSEANSTVDDLREFGVKALAMKADVSNKSDVNRMRADVEKTIGPVTVLVNNAAIFERTPWPGISEESWDRHIDANLKGPFLCAQAFGPGMVERKLGKIINIVDWAAERPYTGYIPYCVSKAGLICLTKALAKTLAPHVQVNAVGPGPVMLPEDMPKEERDAVLKAIPLKREGSPRDVANAVLFLVEGTDFATGSVVYVDGGRLIA